MAQSNSLKAFVDDVLKRVPEDQRDAVRSAYSKAQDEATSLDEAIERTREIARQQTEWYTANKAALEEFKTIKAKEGSSGGTHTIDTEAINKRIDQARDETLGQGLSLIGIGTTIAMNHMKEFGEPLDMEALLNQAVKAGMTLKAYYDQTVAPKRKEISEAKLAADIKAAEERGRAAGVEETLKKVPGGGMPYPVTSGSMQPSTLTGLKPPAEGQAKPDVVGDAARTAMETLTRQANQ